METKKFATKKSIPWFIIYLLLELLLIYFSIIIPYNLIIINHDINQCNHHRVGVRAAHGVFWIWGRTLGFTAAFWFIISTFQGFTMNKHAKLFHKKKKARDLHFISSFICIVFMVLHFVILLISEPWTSIFFLKNRRHLPFEIFYIKIWTGIIFGTIMLSVSLLSVVARKSKMMRKIGYKRFKWIHWILISSIFILIFHILFINTELWIMGFRIGFLESNVYLTLFYFSITFFFVGLIIAIIKKRAKKKKRKKKSQKK